MKTTPYLLVRLCMAASMLGHGLARLPKLAAFAGGLTSSFSKTMLPSFMVAPFAYATPVAELIIGLLLLTGLFTRVALIAGAIEMTLLIFSSCLLESWEVLPSQIIHTLVFAGLLQYTGSNSRALDKVFHIQ